MLAGIGSAWGETTLNADLGESIVGSHARLYDSSSDSVLSSPVLRNYTNCRLMATIARPALQLDGQFELEVALNWSPRVTPDDDMSASSGDLEANGGSAIWRSSLRPGFQVDLVGQPREWLEVHVLERVEYRRFAGLEAETLSWPAATAALGVTDAPQAGSAGDTAAQDSDATVLDTISQDVWTNELNASAVMVPGLRATPDLNVRYVLTRPVKCISESQNTLYSAPNLNTDSFEIRSKLDIGLSEVLESRTLLNLSRWDSRPLSDCEGDTENYRERLHHDVSLMTGIDSRSSDWSMEGQAGGALVWTQQRTEAGVTSSSEGVELRPIGQLSLARLFPRGEIAGRVGTRVYGLLGNPSPTYNVFAKVDGFVSSREHISVHGTVGLLKTFLLSDQDLVTGAFCRINTTQLDAQLLAEWQPTAWLIGRLGYTMSYIGTRNATECGSTLNPSSDGISTVPASELVQLWTNSLSISAVFSLDRDLGAGSR